MPRSPSLPTLAPSISKQTIYQNLHHRSVVGRLIALDGYVTVGSVLIRSREAFAVGV
jgi:hypothetical protein